MVFGMQNQQTAHICQPMALSLVAQVSAQLDSQATRLWDDASEVPLMSFRNSAQQQRHKSTLMRDAALCMWHGNLDGSAT